MSFLRRLFGGPDETPGQPAEPSAGASSAGSGAGATAAETATVRRIVAELEALPPDRARFVAASAYVLARVANADLRVSPEEIEFMRDAVQAGAGLGEAEAVLVVESARQQALLFGSTEDYLVTREFLRISRAEDRSRLIRGCFMAAAAHDEISAAESAVLNQVASELQVPAAEYAALRSEFADRMSVVRAVRAYRHSET